MILQARAAFLPGYNVTPPGGGVIVRLFPGCAADNLAAAARIAEEGPPHFRTLLQSGGELIPFLWAPISPDSPFLWTLIYRVFEGFSLGPPISPDSLSLVNPSLIHQKGPSELSGPVGG